MMIRGVTDNTYMIEARYLIEAQCCVDSLMMAALWGHGR